MLVIPLAQRQSVLVDANIYRDMDTWVHPRGDTEIEGNGAYGIGSNVYSLGFYEYMAVETVIDTVRLKMRCANVNRVLTLRIYARNTASPSGFNLGTAPVLYRGTIPAGHAYGTVTKVMDLDLDYQVVCPKEKYLFVVVSSSEVNEISFARWTVAAGDTPERHGMLSSTSANGSTVGITTPPPSLTYGAATFKLSGRINLTHSLAATWTHPRGEDEVLGETSYAAGPANPAVAIKEQITVATTFQRVRCRIYWKWLAYSPAQETHLYVYVRSTSDHFIPNSATPDAHVVYAPGEFPSTEDVHTFTLNNRVTAAADQWVWVLFYQPGALSGVTSLGYGMFNSAGSGPSRALVTYVANLDSTTWNSGTRYSASFQLLDMIPVPIDLATILNNFPAESVTFEAGGSGMASTDVNDAILEAYNRSSSNILPRIILPDEVVGVVGDQLQLFKRGLIETPDVYGIGHEVLAPSGFGYTYPRYFDVTPTTAGDRTLTVNVTDVEGTTLATDSLVVKVVNPTGQPASEKRVLCVGDSLTQGGQWPQEMYRRLTQSGGTPAGLGYGNITFIGDRPMGSYATQRFVGNSGWSWGNYINTPISQVAYNVTMADHGKDNTDLWSIYEDSSSNQWKIARVISSSVLKVISYSHISAIPAATDDLTHVSGGTHTGTVTYTAASAAYANPFWDATGDALSFAAFATDYTGGNAPDIVYILLGWNDFAGVNKSLAADHYENIAYATTLIDQLHADWPSAVVRLIGLQIPSMRGGDSVYGALDKANWYKQLRSVNGYNLALQNLANDGVVTSADPDANGDLYSDFVKFLNLSCQFDSEYNMPETDAPVNSRSVITEKHGTNTVHPTSGGYYQIADVAYRDFIRSFCSS